MHAMAEVARRAVAALPDTIVLLTPHSPRHDGAFGIWRTPLLRGSLARFGAAQNRVDLPLDGEFAAELEKRAAASGLRTSNLASGSLDHGAVVPLSYLIAAGWHSPTVVVGLDPHKSDGVDEFGHALAATAAALGRRTAIIASGDMSHRLSPAAPLGHDPAGASFDQAFIETLRTHPRRELGGIDRRLVDQAGEDVLDVTRIAVSATDYASDGANILSYEGPFGVGYGVAVLMECPGPSAATLKDPAMGGVLSHRADLPAVARWAVSSWLENRLAEVPFSPTGNLLERHGLFVNVRTREGALRGSWGTPTATERTLLHETWHCARGAAFDDPRNPPLKPDELRRVRFSVSILGAFEPVGSLSELDPEIFGVSVRSVDGRNGLLLPGLKGIDTSAEQVRFAKRKGGFGPHEPADIARFTSQTYHEPPLPEEAL